MEDLSLPGLYSIIDSLPILRVELFTIRQPKTLSDNIRVTSVAVVRS
jgi:hypothetical protein